MRTQSNEYIEALESVNNKDTKVDKIPEGIDLTVIQERIKNEDIKLVFPVCGKRCYNTLCNSKNKMVLWGETDYSAAQSWENDGDCNTESSIEVLIDWITTKENASRYFGGLDIEGRTIATRKESNHHQIKKRVYCS